MIPSIRRFPRSDALARILVVDDDRSTRSLCTILLGELGHEVCAAATISEALNVAVHENIDLALTDWTLPDGSGESLLGKFPFPAIAVTGSDDCERSIRAGFVAHLTKPIDLDSLV